MVASLNLSKGQETQEALSCCLEDAKPILWVDSLDQDGCDRHAKNFQLLTPNDQPKPGYHVIALKEERDIRRVIRKLQSLEVKGIRIYPAELMPFAIEIDILVKGQYLELWLTAQKQTPLTLQEALAIASSILEDTTISRTRRNIELEELRERCLVSSFDWNRYIADLEAEIHAAVDEKKQTDRHERLRLEIKALLKEADPIAYEITKADIQSRYRLNTKALETIIRSVGHLAKEAEVEDLGLDELFDLPTENIEYVIPGKLPVGEAALLIADPKAGKTLLAYDAAFAVATGEDTFLGEQCKQGKVLIVQCDESKGTAKGRLLKRGFRREDTPNVRFMHKFSITQLGALETKLETFRPTLVIIDSLRRINAGREISENSAEFADTIYQLKELCSQYNAALILIHHSNKNADAVGVQKARGSSAITGATWGIWELTQIPKPDPNNKKKLIIDPKDPTRILSIIARDVEGQRLIIELDPENNHWIERGEQGADEEEIREQKNHSSKVVELLRSAAPMGLEASEINEALGIGRGIYSTLNRLLGQKIIGSRSSTKDRRRTVYFVGTVTQEEGLATPQKSGNPPPPTLTDPNVIEYAESITTSSFQSSITNRSQSITIDHNSPSKEVCDQTLNVEPVSNTEYSITTPHCGGGRVSEPDVIDSQLAHTSHHEEPDTISPASRAIAPSPTPAAPEPAALTKSKEAIAPSPAPPEPAAVTKPEDSENVEEAIAPSRAPCENAPADITIVQVADVALETSPLLQKTSVAVTESTHQFEAGDRVQHPVFGYGTLNNLIGSTAFCKFDEVRDSTGRKQRNAMRSPRLEELRKVT